jgi:hypothetical protein
MVVSLGSFIEAYPLFDLNLQDYDELFIEKLDLLLKIRDNEYVRCPVSFVRHLVTNLFIQPLQ